LFVSNELDICSTLIEYNIQPFDFQMVSMSEPIINSIDPFPLVLKDHWPVLGVFVKEDSFGFPLVGVGSGAGFQVDEPPHERKEMGVRGGRHEGWKVNEIHPR
jgi:hypothetical protein